MNLQVLNATVAPSGQISVTFNRMPVSPKKLVCNNPKDLRPLILPPRFKSFLTDCLRGKLIKQVVFDNYTLHLPVATPAGSKNMAVIVALKEFVEFLASVTSTVSPFIGLTEAYISRRSRFVEDELPTPIEQAIQCLLVVNKPNK